VRTTLNIDNDVLHAVRERARRQKRSAGEVLSELARRGLLGRPASEEVAEAESFYGFEPLPSRGQAVSNELIDRLREEEPE
jgi:hypothetical protein